MNENLARNLERKRKTQTDTEKEKRSYKNLLIDLVNHVKNCYFLSICFLSLSLSMQLTELPFTEGGIIVLFLTKKKKGKEKTHI